MSAKIMGEVYDLDLTTTEQSVLLALADHADHNGDNVRPGIEFLVWKTGISERHVKRVLERLEAARIIIPRSGAQGGRGRVTEYSIRLSNGVKKPPFTRALPPAKRRRKGDSLSLFPDTETVTPSHPLISERVPTCHPFAAERVPLSPTKGDSESVKGDSESVKGDSESSAPIRARLNHQEPSEEPEEREGARVEKIVTHCGSGERPAPPTVEEVAAFLAASGWPEQHAALFHAYYDERDWTTGKDRQPVRDWRKKLKTWVAREGQFAGNGSRKPGDAPTPPGQSALVNGAIEMAERWRQIKAARGQPPDPAGTITERRTP